MRVIAGSAKGTRLAHVPAGTRPLSDRAREGMFSSLAGRVAGARVLDLYAGTGALGIEALSRGAETATLVDSGRQAVEAIRDNLARTKLADRAVVARADVPRFLVTERAPFDLVFLDPPHQLSERDVSAVLSRLSRGWLAPGFTVALTRARQDYTGGISVDWPVARRLGYGDTLVILYRED
jgi:16S rRNA (guanine966-N2)-methyltransferase